ncbi:MAG: deiodinase-like protein, partial [Planctomycetaceae bacterium]
RPGEFTAPAARAERNPEVLKAGDMAPEFTLPRVDGTGTLSLAELRREKPVVLVFGSISCSPFRRQVQAVEKLHQQYQDQIQFVMIYIREAHPDSEIFVRDDQGKEVLKKFTQTDQLELRKSHAKYCDRTLSLSFPMLMDSVDNRTNVAYSGWPIRLVIVGTDGRVISPGAQGPQGFDPQAVAKWADEYTRNRQAAEN